MKRAIENPSRAGRTTRENAPKDSAGLLLLYAEAARAAQEDAAMDAAGILEQAEEANALDPVG